MCFCAAAFDTDTSACNFISEEMFYLLSGDMIFLCVGYW